MNLAEFRRADFIGAYDPGQSPSWTCTTSNTDVSSKDFMTLQLDHQVEDHTVQTSSETRSNVDLNKSQPHRMIPKRIAPFEMNSVGARVDSFGAHWELFLRCMDLGENSIHDAIYRGRKCVCVD